MKDKRLSERIARAKQLLAEIHHVPVATVNDDGTPHNSPVFMAFDDKLCGYWASHTASQHSCNIARSGQVFLTIFDSREGHGGLFIRAEAVALNTYVEVVRGYTALKALKERFYGTMGDIETYTKSSGQRIYCARPLQCWINKSDRDQNGAIIRDRRYEVALGDLLY